MRIFLRLRDGNSSGVGENHETVLRTPKTHGVTGLYNLKRALGRARLYIAD
jgi:hypothetical protein